MLAAPLQASAAGCGINVSVQPGIVNYPAQSLPGRGSPSFGERVDINYSSAYLNRTITLQYLSGSVWYYAQNLTGNAVGFTRTFFGLETPGAEFGNNSVRAVSGGCVSNVASYTVRADPSAASWTVATYALLALGAALFALAGWKLSKKWFLVMAALVYLALAPFTGQRYDLYFLISSGIRLLQHVNPFYAGSPPVYPGAYKWAFLPLYVPYSSLSFLMYQLFTGAALPSVSALTQPSWYTSMFDVWQSFVNPSLPVLVFLLKLPIVLSTVLTGFLLQRMTGSRLAGVAWLANPLVILVGAVWGAIDPIATLLAVAAIYMFNKGKTYHAYTLASFGAAAKIWPALLIPLFLAVEARRDGFRALRPFLATLPAVALTVFLYAVAGNLASDLYVLVYARAVPTFYGLLSVNGLTWQQILLYLQSPAYPIFLWIGVPAYAAIVAWVYYSRTADMVKWGAVSVLVFFLTYNYVNPQYFVWILPLLILERRRVAVAVFSILPMVYVFLSYDLFYFISPAILPNEFVLGSSVLDQLKVIAFTQSVVPYLFITAALPTAAYVVLLAEELRPRLWRRNEESQQVQPSV